MNINLYSQKISGPMSVAPPQSVFNAFGTQIESSRAVTIELLGPHCQDIHQLSYTWNRNSRFLCYNKLRVDSLAVEIGTTEKNWRQMEPLVLKFSTFSCTSWWYFVFWSAKY